MSVIKKISLKDAVGTATIYDIGSMAENVMYDEDSSVKDKLDNLNIRYLGSQLQVWDSVNEVWVNKIQLDDATYYVDGTNGSDTNAGTQANPFATIDKAIAMIGSDSFRSATAQIIVSDGTYTENITIIGKNVSITGASGASSNVVIEGTLSASNFAKVYINKIRFNVSNYANVNAIAASNGAYIVAAGGVIVQGDGSNTGFYAFDNGNIKVANSDFVNMDCAFKADGGTIRVNNAPKFTTVAIGALVTNGGVIHLRNDISEIAGVTTPYNKTNAYGGRIFVGSEDTMKGATSTTNGTGGTVPAPSAGDENKALFGDGTWKPVSGGGGGHTILDEDGVTYPQRSKLQFEGCEVTDDAVNGITVVEATPDSVGAVDVVEYEEDIYGVNLLDLKSVNAQTGITYVIDNNNRVTLSGTLSQGNWLFQYSARAFSNAVKLKQGVEYVFSIGVSIPHVALQVGYTHPTTGAYTQVAQSENGASELKFTSPVSDCPWTIQLVSGRVTLSSVVTYPMLYKASIKVDDYIPFNEQAIQNQLTEQTNVLGAKNLIPYPYKDGDAKTALGVTYAVNSDKSVKLNGIATSSGGFNLCLGKPLSYFGIYQPGKYILSCGDFSVASGDRVYFAIKDATKGTYYNTWRSGISSDNPEQEIVIDSNNINDIFDSYIWVQSGVTVNNAVVKPMLRLASDPDNTYVPYAMTNRELTERMLRLSVFNSNYSIPIADCDSFIGVFGATNASTLNTPYKAGLAGGYAAGMIIQIVPNTTGLWNTQIYIASGCGNTSSPSTTNVIFIRAKSNSSAWSPWTKLI